MANRLLISFFSSLFVLVSFGQARTNNDSLPVNFPGIKVTLLGTGNPQPLMDRFGPSILVQAGSQTLLFDAGRGCLQRLHQIDVSYGKINALFLTHLHSDHIVGLPDLWLTGWLLSGRQTPLDVFGPLGTKDMVDHLQMAFAFDIKIRAADDVKFKEGSKLPAVEVKEGVVYKKNGVTVIAFKVDHHPDIPAYGYRVEYNGHAVVLSGDTRYSENLIKFAKGADLLIHEVVIAPDTLNKDEPGYRIWSLHTTPGQAARIFSQVKPKLAAYSHIIKLNGRDEKELFSRTKAGYSGPIVVGEDLMNFLITDTVSVNRWQNN